MISDNLESVLRQLPDGVRLIAVSKLKPVEDILEAYQAGQHIFGENYATELRDKYNMLCNPQSLGHPATQPLSDIEWHFIGHLQSKQLKYYIPFVSMIHGVDSITHLADVDKAASKVGRTVDVLLQVHVAQEETKFGFSPDELSSSQIQLSAFPNVRICGIMGMASHTDDISRVRTDFHTLRTLFEQLKTNSFASHPEFRELSMGMSHDWHIAVDEGSTLIRLGTAIFGPRDYSKKP